MKTSERGKRFIGAREGVRTQAYKDTKGLLTIGIGHLLTDPELKTGLIKIGKLMYNWRLGLTMPLVYKLFDQDFLIYENAVNERFKNVALSQHEFDALVSITFNIGTNGMKSSTFARLIESNAHDSEIAEAIMMWNKPKEIIGRRMKERDLFIKGIYA